MFVRESAEPNYACLNRTPRKLLDAKCEKQCEIGNFGAGKGFVKQEGGPV